MMDPEKDLKSRKALASVACNKLEELWHSTLPDDTKIYLIPVLWIRNLDANTEIFETTGWNLYKSP